MQKLHIPATRNTPLIYLSPDENLFSIKGMSAPEDVRTLYYPVIEWVKNFVDNILEGVIKSFNKESPVRLQIDLSYFNSSSAKFLFDILMEFKRLILADAPFVVDWYHDEGDTDLTDAGNEFSDLAGIKFNFVIKPKN